MSSQLRHVPFTADMLSKPSVQSFDCGTEVWEQEISDWLKGPEGTSSAVEDIKIAGNLVWLYVAEEGELVGVGSIGPSNVSWPKNSSPRQQASCITWLAVDKGHRCKGYGQQILDHLLSEAKIRMDRFPFVVLYVHTGNQDAHRWYTNAKNNFVPIGKPTERNGRMYQRLAISLGAPA